MHAFSLRSVAWNHITGEAAESLATVVLEHKSLTDFCGLPLASLRENTLEQLELKSRGVGVPGALVLARLLPFATSLMTIE